MEYLSKPTFTDLPSPLVQNPSFPYGQARFGDMNEIRAGKGATSFSMDQSGIWLGAERFENAPFKVTMAGVATFTGMVSDWNDITGKPDFGALALKDMVGVALLDSTVISGGYIKTTLINASAIAIGSLSGAGLLASKNSVDYITSDITNKPTLGSLASQSSVEYAMLGSTLIVGGYLKTVLINADAITAGTITGIVIKTSNNFGNVKLDSSGGGRIIFTSTFENAETGYISTKTIGSADYLHIDGSGYGGGAGDGIILTGNSFFDNNCAVSGTLSSSGKFKLPVGTNLY